MLTLRPLLASVLLLTSALVSASPTGSNTTSTTTSTPTPTPTAPLCEPEFQGIVLPTPGATITQVDDGKYGLTTFEVVYCSGQYFKTQSIDASVLLSFPDSLDGGMLLIKDQEPDNEESSAGFYSYRFNVTLQPENGDYPTGERLLNVYETSTGYYNPINFEISSINITLAVSKSQS